MANIVKNYYLLTKPGIIYGNALPAIAGFLFASGLRINPLLFFSAIAGLSFVIASACVFNNYIDRNLDEKMERTKKRALVTKEISPVAALTYGTVLGIIGFGTLLFWTNVLTMSIAFVGFFFYVVLYGIAKRRSIYGTLVGSIPGAVPPVVGYTAVTNRFDLTALLLFLILVAWQMPHFYAIATYRFKDYAAAGLPVLPVKKGIGTAKIHILFWVCVFTVVATLFTVTKQTGFIYLVIMTLLGLRWLFMGIQGFGVADDVKWARKMFGFSLIALLTTSFMLAIGRLLP